MTDADGIRMYARDTYVVPARRRKAKELSIRVGDVVRGLRLKGRVPAVCSALKTREFLESNSLRLLHASGPESGQSTTVVYTYRLLSEGPEPEASSDAWKRLRGALNDVLSELGGGEHYIHQERNTFSSDHRTS